MKTRIILIAFFLLAATYFVSAKPVPDVEVNFGYFYQNLAPLGTWMQIEDGIYGWRPNRVNSDWRPYSIGRWAWTEQGWYWDSYEPFGWATYHYGRWTNDEYYGWIWVPDYEWAPSWVEWRYDDDYIGWAPLPLYAAFRIGLGIHFSMGWNSHHSHWNFVRHDHFCHNRVFNYYLDNNHVNRFFSRTKYRTNYYDRDNRIINGGVDRDFVERRGGARIRETSIRNTSDLRDISRNSASRDSYVRAFRPNEDDVRRTRDIQINNISRSERSINIDRDKIAIRTSRENGIVRERNTSNTSERPTVNSDRATRSSTYFEKPVIRNDRNTQDTRERVIERPKQNTETNYERRDREVQRRETLIPERNVVRETKRSEPQRTEMYNNRSESKVERSAERSAPRENRSSERKVETRSSERSAPPARSSNSNNNNNNSSRERKR